MTAHYPRDPTTAAIDAAAARLAGSPQQLAERLAALLDAGPPAPPKGAASSKPEALADHRRAIQQHADDIAALRHRLASDFAEARGWRANLSPLSVREVARRALPGKWHRPNREWLGTLFHPAFFRDEGGRAAGVVAHPLAEEVGHNPDHIGAWAAERDLVATFPPYPSWQQPGRAVLVVLEAAEPLVAPAQQAETSETAPDVDGLLELYGVASPAPVASDPDPVSGPVPEIVHPDPAPPTVPGLPDMRPVAPIDLDGAVPRDLADEVGPDFDIVAPGDLLVDGQYQRSLSPKSLELIRRIVRTWSWAKFKPPVCVRVDGRFHVLDGQHTAIAAATHGDIGAIPIVVIAGEMEVSDRAAAFVSHATDRLQATALQIHRAALVAGDEDAVALDRVCRAAGVEVLAFAPSDGRYQPRQTVALVGVRRLIARRGPERAQEILAALAGADLAPISGDHVRIAEALLCDPAYADGIDPERLTAALRGLTAKAHAEARELAIAQRLPAWRALAAVLYRSTGRSKPKGRGRVGA